jgi:hypothetical protein
MYIVYLIIDKTSSSATLCGVDWQFVTDVSVQDIRPVHEGQTAQEGYIPYGLLDL